MSGTVREHHNSTQRRHENSLGERLYSTVVINRAKKLCISLCHHLKLEYGLYMLLSGVRSCMASLETLLHAVRVLSPSLERAPLMKLYLVATN